MVWVLRCAFLLVMCLAMAARATGPLLPVEPFFSPPEAQGAKLSPGGRWLAALHQGQGERTALVLFDLEKGGPGREVVRFTNIDLNSLVWVDDERLIFTVADHDPSDHGPVVTAATWLLSIKPDGSTDYRDLADRFWAVLASGADGGWWLGMRMQYDQMGEPRAQRAMRFPLDAQPRWPHTPDPPLNKHLNFDAPDGVTRWLFSPGGQPRVVVTRDKARRIVHWRGPEDTTWRRIGEVDLLSPQWWPLHVDAQGTLWVGVTEGPAGEHALSTFDFAAGKPRLPALLATPGFDVRPSFVTDSSTGRLLGVHSTSDAALSVWFDERMKVHQAAVDGLLSGRVNVLQCARCSSDDATVMVVSWTDRDPGAILLYRPKSGTIKPVLRLRRNIDPARMAPLRFERIKSRDGHALPLWLTLPVQQRADAAPKAPLPAVVLVHGGPGHRGAEWEWEGLRQFLASRGYAVIEPEFRGSTGYGAAHEQRGWREWGGAMQADVADAVAWAVQAKLVDPQRVCIAGGSYGGYAALIGPVLHPGVYRCVAAWAAVTDPALLYRSTWQSDLSETTKEYVLPRTMGDLGTDAERLARASPLRQAARIGVPVLLGFGADDSRVPIFHGSRMRSALEAAGNPPEYVVYVEGHSWRQRSWVDFAGRLERFLARHLADKP